jgi:hypothetical protein
MLSKGASTDAIPNGFVCYMVARHLRQFRVFGV